MKNIQINSDKLKQYIKTPTLYFHDSHVQSFEYANNILKIVFERFDKTVGLVVFNDVAKIEYRIGDSSEIDLKDRILDVDIKTINDRLVVNILMFNMSFIDIYCYSINIE